MNTTKQTKATGEDNAPPYEPFWDEPNYATQQPLNDELARLRIGNQELYAETKSLANQVRDLFDKNRELLAAFKRYVEAARSPVMDGSVKDADRAIRAAIAKAEGK